MLEGKSDDTHVIRELRFVLGDSFFFASNARTRPDSFRSIGVVVNFWLILFYELIYLFMSSGLYFQGYFVTKICR